MHIDENTRISKIISHTPASIEAIVSISKHFEKLRIPILRKTLASRVTIKQAAKIGGVSVYDFFEKLSPLGFTYTPISKTDTTKEIKTDALFFENLNEENIVSLDVRGVLKQNLDPFNMIMEAINKLQNEQVLNIINTFEPIPLINILSKKGYAYQAIQKDKELVYTCFKKQTNNVDRINISENNTADEFEDIIKKYKTKQREIDVRNLEMPLPMHTILSELETLPNDFLLFVHHKKVPKFLLPELAERGYLWKIKEIKDGDVKMCIFKLCNNQQ